ncbi:hypothetical protein M446_5951 [Methylobacterium sp. 4-46]|nr:MULTISPECIES: hypothetical protein [Methylobacterium]ACA20231.1 hypothetical protein M446_5951 [Methylobacterium sp. 4-46]WFT79408.1 hypothetical protein QA634_30045 [Methylobacterium nodulans]
MKAALIVLWTLAAGVLLFVIVRRRIDRALRDLDRNPPGETREAGRDPEP